MVQMFGKKINSDFVPYPKARTGWMLDATKAKKVAKKEFNSSPQFSSHSFVITPSVRIIVNQTSFFYLFFIKTDIFI
jgi:hypothetical protein